MNETADSVVKAEINGITYKLTRLTVEDFGQLEDYIRSCRLRLLREKHKAKEISDDQYLSLMEHIFDPRVEFTVMDDITLSLSPRGMAYTLHLAMRKHHHDMTPERIARELPVAEMMAIVQRMNGLATETETDTETGADQGPEVA